MPLTQFRTTLAASLLGLGLIIGGCSQSSANASNATDNAASGNEVVATGAAKKAVAQKVVLLNVFGMT